MEFFLPKNPNFEARLSLAKLGLTVFFSPEDKKFKIKIPSPPFKTVEKDDTEFWIYFNGHRVIKVRSQADRVGGHNTLTIELFSEDMSSILEQSCFMLSDTRFTSQADVDRILTTLYTNAISALYDLSLSMEEIRKTLGEFEKIYEIHPREVILFLQKNHKYQILMSSFSTLKDWSELEKIIQTLLKSVLSTSTSKEEYSTYKRKLTEILINPDLKDHQTLRSAFPDWKDHFDKMQAVEKLFALRKILSSVDFTAPALEDDSAGAAAATPALAFKAQATKKSAAVENQAETTETPVPF